MESKIAEGVPPRRRRSRGFVTQNACTECRRRRAKCDGQAPCGSCAARNVPECIYDVPTRVSKENMRREIEKLQERLHVRETVIAALVMKDSSNPVLQQLRDKVPLEEIADQVQKSFPSLRGRIPLPREETISSETNYSSYETSASEYWKSHLSDPGNTMQPWQVASYVPKSQEPIEEEDFDEAMEGVDTQWTEVSTDKAMIKQMFELYFCWEHPILQTLSKEHFLSDFEKGTHRYCSSLLVNAMLALGCRLSIRQENQLGLNKEYETGSCFYEETKRLLATANIQLLPTVQALGLMSLYEASCGRDGESWFLSCRSIQLAMEMGLHIEMPINDQLTAIEQEVRTVTFWGAFSLHQTWSLALGRLPYTSKSMNRLTKCPLIESIENSPWVPYRQGITQERSFEEPGHIRTIHRCLCELSEIIQDSVYGLYTPGGNLSGKILLEIYRHHLAWKGSLPEPCHLSPTPIPAVLYLHIYYHFALIMLFRPFIKLRFLDSAVSPLDVCVQAANTISSLTQTYEKTYSLRQTPVFVPYMLLASAIAHLVTVRSVPAPFGESSSVLPELAQLQVLSARYPFSKRAISIIQFLARQWGTHFLNSESSDQTASTDDICLPIPGKMNFFCPRPEFLETSLRERVDSALFGPFPMQGLPLLSGSLPGMARTGLQWTR